MTYSIKTIYSVGKVFKIAKDGNEKGMYGRNVILYIMPESFEVGGYNFIFALSLL